MRRVSHKRQEKISASRPVRDALIELVGKCELCGASPAKPRHPIKEQNMLCCHEVLNGPLREKVLAETCCLIVACWKCNGEELNCKGDFPLSRQLAIIKHRAPWRYNLLRVLELRDPRAMRFVTEDEVDSWVERDWGVET